MYSYLTIFCLVLFPVLGLISCAPDKKNDDWMLPEPTVQESNFTEVAEVSLREVKSVLPASAVLHFAADKMPRTRVNFKTLCQNSDGVFSREETFHQVTAVPLSAILPQKLIADPNPHLNEDMICSFKLRGDNQWGSIHEFAIDGIHIGPLAELETLAQDNTFRSRADESVLIDLNLANPPDLRIAEGPEYFGPNKLRWFELACDDFDNYRKYDANQTLGAVMSELLKGPSLDSQGHERKKDLRRQERTLQNCRLLQKTMDRLTGVVALRTTPAFKTIFPLPKLDVIDAFTRVTSYFSEMEKSWAFTEQNDSDNLINQPLMQLTLRNSGSVKTRLTIPSSFTATVAMIFRTKQDFAFSNPVNLPVALNVDGAIAELTSEGTKEFEIQPHTEVRIILVPTVPFYLLTEGGDLTQIQNWKEGQFAGIGIGLKTSSELVINYALRDKTKNNYSPKVYKRFADYFPATGQFQHFIPAQKYVDWAGRKSLPSPIRTVPFQSEIFCNTQRFRFRL